MLATLLLATALAPARFAAAPGWHVGAGRVHRCPGVAARRCEEVTTWASTARWRDCVECLPHRTLEHMAPDGLALQLHLSRERTTPTWMRPLSWPPPLKAVPGFEGLPPRIAVVQVLGTIHGYHAYLFVFFGRPRPTTQQLRRARKELVTVAFP
jgi:hypothetical protein